MRGILHRDLKPANILVDAKGRPHVTDFGLAKRVEADVEMTASGAIVGTPAYMSPEQAEGRRGSITTTTDVHGLGAVLYALLTGQAPFAGDSVIDTLTKVKEQPPEPPSKLNTKVPGDLETIALKCLEKDPRRRYASALAEDLHNWLACRPISARRVGSAERAWLWCKRRPAIAALSATTVAALVGGTIASTLFGFHARSEARRANLQAGLAKAASIRAEYEAERAATARKERDRSEHPRVTTGRRGSGTGRPAARSPYSAGSLPWSSCPTARASSPEGAMARHGSGTR
jgi:eukaryotic-like serine/threonine-protein kinase